MEDTQAVDLVPTADPIRSEEVTLTIAEEGVPTIAEADPAISQSTPVDTVIHTEGGTDGARAVNVPVSRPHVIWKAGLCVKSEFQVIEGSDAIFDVRIRAHPDTKLALWPQALTRRERPLREAWLQPVDALGGVLALRRFPGYSREITEEPPEWVSPPEELLLEVEQLQSYRDLFTDKADALHGAMEWARNPVGRELEKVVPFELYTPLARRALELGFVFSVEPITGKPSVQRVGPIPAADTTVDREKLARWAEDHGWPDRRTI